MNADEAMLELMEAVEEGNKAQYVWALGFLFAMTPHSEGGQMPSPETVTARPCRHDKNGKDWCQQNGVKS